MNQIGTAGILLSVFIAVIIGIAFLTSSADTITDVTSIQSVTNETMTLYILTYTNTSHTNTVAVSELRNCTNGTTILPASYVFTAGSGIHTVSENFSAACVDYTFKGTNYVEDSTARAVINLVILMFALAIIATAMIATKPLWEEGFLK